MKRTLILAALGMLSAHVTGLSLSAQESGQPLPSVPPLLAEVGQPKETKIPAPKDAAPAPAAVIVPGPGAVVVAPSQYHPMEGSPFCDNGCCNQRMGLSAGAGFYYLRPHWDDAPAFTVTTNTTVGAVNQINTTQTNLTFDNSFSPKLWVAYSGEDGLTARASWFRLDTTTANTFQLFANNPAAGIARNAIIPGGNNVDPAFGDFSGVIFLGAGALAPGQSFDTIVDARLQLQTIDLDITQQCKLGCWELNVGGGLRYARLEQTFNAFVNQQGIVGGGLNRNELHLSNVFEGVGLQAIVEARRSLNECYGLNVYGNARAGILYGQRRLGAQSSVLAGVGAAQTLNVTNRGNTQDDSLPYLELEAGVEWSRQMDNGMTPFARVGVVGHQWFGTGSPSSSINNRDSDLGLFGLQVMAGVSY